MAQNRLTDKLAVILHADIAGSTQMVQLDEHLAHERIQQTFQTFSNTIAKCSGKVLELRGDALVAEFERPSNAVTAALSFQADHSDYLTSIDDEIRPEVRVGIAMGEVVIADNTVTGAGVVMAQRVEQLADNGGLCITAAVRESLSRRLHVVFENLGQQEIKGFEETIRVYKVTASSDFDIPLPEAKPATARFLAQWRLSGTLAVIVLIVAGVFYWVYTNGQSENISSADSSQDKPTIAVLPFINMSGDPEQEYFADGMTEDLITDISKVSGLFVIARNSVFTYKGKAVKVQQIAEELGVRYVMEGSVRRAGDQVRINAQLIDATTGGHIWAERYDGSLADVFLLQDQVTAKIVNALSIKLTPQELENLEAVETLNTAAHDAYLQGLSYYLRNTPADNAKSEAYFKRAVELDPEFKRAYAALAKAYFRTIDYDYGDAMGTYWRIGIYLTQKNLAKVGNADISDAYVVRARIALNKHQVGVALRETEQALKLSNNDVEALKAKAIALIYSGQYSEGRKIANLVLRLDPAVPEDPLNLIGLSHFAEGNYKAAVDYIERALKHNPTTSYFAGPLAAAYGKLGNEIESKQAFKRHLDGWLSHSPRVDQVVYFYPFQDEAVLEHLADGFAVAGAREGLLERYLKLTPETRLSGQEIKSLLFGQTIRGRDYWSGRPWTQVRTHEGKFSHSNSSTTREGESWIDNDRVCDRWLDDGDEITLCSLIFHDPVKCWTNDKGLRRCGTVVPTQFAQSVEIGYRMLTDQGPDSIRVKN